MHIRPTRRNPKGGCGCGKSRGVTNPRPNPNIKRTIRKK